MSDESGDLLPDDVLRPLPEPVRSQARELLLALAALGVTGSGLHDAAAEVAASAQGKNPRSS